MHEPLMCGICKWTGGHAAGCPGRSGDDDDEAVLHYWQQRSSDYEQAMRNAIDALMLAYRHVSSMLPERLDAENKRLHEQAMKVLRAALD